MFRDPEKKVLKNAIWRSKIRCFQNLQEISKISQNKYKGTKQVQDEKAKKGSRNLKSKRLESKNNRDKISKQIVLLSYYEYLN